MSGHASSFKQDQELMAAYLKHTSTVTGTDRRNTVTNKDGSAPDTGNGSKPFEMASDEDLLGSNFDRISKILPNHDQINEQLPDFNCEDSGSPPRRAADSVNAKKVQM